MNWDLRHLFVVFQCRILKYLMRGLLQHWTKSSIIPISREEPVWRTKGPKGGPFPSRQTDCLLDLRLLSGHWEPWFCRKLYRPIHCPSTKWWYSGIRFKVGRNFIVYDENPAWWHLGTIVQTKNTSLKNIRPYWNCTTWRLIRRSVNLIFTDWKRWWREVSSKEFEMIILGAEMEILRRTPWSRIREQNSVYKEFLEIVGNGKPTGSVWKETIAVSATIWISVEKLHHQIRLRILSCSRVSENHREPEVPEAEVPVVERLDGLARIIEELAITHFVKNGTLQNGTLQNACSARPRVVVDLGRSAHSHTVRLMNSRQKGLKRMMTKVQWPCWRRVIGKKENLSPMNVTIDRRNLGRRVIRNWDKIHLNVNHLMHGNWVVYFRTWRRRSLFFGSAQTCRSQSHVWSSQRLLNVTLKFETKILRSDIFAQVNLMSVAPTLQNLRIVTRRESGKTKVPAKQRGSWPKVCSN